MFRQVLCSALVFGTVFCGTRAAFAESRLALVIGQSAYQAVTPLPNPANDARAMSKLLGDAGFEVTLAGDLTQKEMNQKVGDFAAEIAAKGPDTVALVFYAGHGLQVDGENYLVPVDVDPKREADIPLQAVRLNDILNTLNSVPSRMRIILLDACRNNPFPAISASTGQGLALVDTKTGAPGTFLSYSTSPGAEAEDGDGADSPYTTALLSAVREPGLPIEQAFKQVRVAVNKATDGRQTPWDSSSLTEDFRFIAGPALAGASSAPLPVATKSSVDDWRRVLQSRPIETAHEMIVADGTLEAYEAFVALFAQSRFAPEVRAWIDRQTRMVAWNNAVLVNTAASYRAFLADYPDSDLTATARRLIIRLQNRPIVLPAAIASANALALPQSANNPSSQNCTTSPSTPSMKKADLAPLPSVAPLVQAALPPHPVELPVRPVVLPRHPVDPPVRVTAQPPRAVATNVGPIYRRPPMFFRPMGIGFAGGFRRPMGFGRRF